MASPAIASDPNGALRSPLPAALRERLAPFTWPALAAGFWSLAIVGLQRGIDPPVLAAGLTVLNFAALVGLERLLPRLPGTDLLRDPQSRNDVAHGVLFTFVARPLAGALCVAGVALAARGLGAMGFVGPWPGGWPLPLQVVAGIVLWSFSDYWIHRAYHEIDRLWWFHAIHHDTPQMHVLKSGRLHAGEEFLNALLKPVPLLLLGTPELVMVCVGLWGVFEGNAQHSNLDQRFPHWAHYLIPTVQLHAIHHSRERAWQDSNYAGNGPFWDVVFGTYRHPDRHPTGPLGLAGDYVPRGFLAQVLFPFRAVLRPPDSTERAGPVV
jgi:sterol desaturase/sphingolipid hydroxylase (fatty acid hydroxylase superfamily)